MPMPVDEQEKPVPGAGVNINIAGRHMAMELLLDTFKTGGFYGLLCWNKLFDIRLFRDKGVHFDETMFFGDDAASCTACMTARMFTVCRACCTTTGGAAAR